jgi:hypothetical protein
MVLKVANGLRVREAKSTDKAKASLLIAILISIFVLSNPISAKADGSGLLVMETFRRGISPLEDITVKCFYFDNLNNARRDDPWNVKVPIGKRLGVRLMIEREYLENLKIKGTSNIIQIINPGPITTWTITPYQKGKYQFILEYFIGDTQGTKRHIMPSGYIRI